MKKIMIAFAIAAVAAISHAAAFNWTVNAGTQYADYKVYLTSSAGTFANIDAITEALVGASGNTGTLVAGSRSATVSGGVKGIASEGSVDYYYVFVKDNDYWVSGKQSIVAVAETATPNKNTFSATNANALLSGSATGSFSSAPEPTSGLLLLFGMAGLALKRKVA